MEIHVIVLHNVRGYHNGTTTNPIVHPHLPQNIYAQTEMLLLKQERENIQGWTNDQILDLSHYIPVFMKYCLTNLTLVK